MRSSRTLTSEQRALADDPVYQTLACQIANRMARRYRIDRDEARSSAAFGLVMAAANYRPDLGHPFPAFAAPRIRGAILDDVRTSFGAGFTGSRGVPRGVVSADEEVADELSHATTLPARELPVGWEIESQDAVEHTLRPLDPRAARMVKSLFLHAGVTQAEIARREGIHFANVFRAVDKAISCLRADYQSAV